jgi:nucleoside-specific outer membrane channel protein Tsx
MQLSRSTGRTARLRSIIYATAVLIGSTAVSVTHAADWSTTNIQYLQGSGYQLNPTSDMTIMTFEHADGWGYGDNFFFFDVNYPMSTNTSYYGEYSPRLSLGKMTGSDLSFGPAQDVMLAFGLEFGIGFPLKIPKFAFFDFNFYARQSYLDGVGSSQPGYQATIDWLLPFSIGKSKWQFTGFVDYAFGENGGAFAKADNLIAGPQLLVDLTNLMGAKGKGKVLGGVEYQVWNNKYGVDGVNESIPQVMLKWIM